jgi:hypothetical protein
VRENYAPAPPSCTNGMGAGARNNPGLRDQEVRHPAHPGNDSIRIIELEPRDGCEGRYILSVTAASVRRIAPVHPPLMRRDLPSANGAECRDRVTTQQTASRRIQVGNQATEDEGASASGRTSYHYRDDVPAPEPPVQPRELVSNRRSTWRRRSAPPTRRRGGAGSGVERERRGRRTKNAPMEPRFPKGVAGDHDRQKAITARQCAS